MLTTFALPSLAIAFPNIDPILLEIGPFSVRWYSLSYVAGILLGWWYLHKLNAFEPPALSQKALDDIMIWAIFGVILGGRLGYVAFYNLEYFLAHPNEIIQVWKGGMSFHGGLIGVILAIYLMCLRNKIAFWPVMDRVACVTPIGLFLGRVANFINGELYGRVTDMPWGMIFPGDPFARHPSQLYEAVLEGLVLFIILSIAVRKSSIRLKPAMLSGIFLIGYGVARSTAEIFREPDAHLGFIIGELTMGQVLCIPMILLGVVLMLYSRMRHRA